MHSVGLTIVVGWLDQTGIRKSLSECLNANYYLFCQSMSSNDYKTSEPYHGRSSRAWNPPAEADYPILFIPRSFSQE